MAVSDWQKKYKNILVSIEKEKQKLPLLFSSVHIVHMYSFNFIKIFSFDISNRYFYCFAYWLLLSSFLVIAFVTHTYFLLEKVFCLFPVPGFRVSAIDCVRERVNLKRAQLS